MNQENDVNQRVEMSDMVRDFFGGDAEKMQAWWNTPNPLLGDKAPITMRSSPRLYQFIKAAVVDGRM